MEKYVYSNLSQSRSIRVIELSPSLRSSGPISIQLREMVLDETRFEALSYSWDGQGLTEIINCGGRELLITPTCEAALRRLRLAKRTRILWIDQICINQESIDEKNQQVKLMGDLYSVAEKVIVWLGVHSAADKLLEYVNIYWLLELVKKVPLAGRLQYRMRFKCERKLREKVHLQLPALHPIAWFDRMWTIQEVAVAQQVQIVSSKRSMDYDQFMSSLDLWLIERLNQRMYDDSFGQIRTVSDPTSDQLGARKVIRDLLHPIPKAKSRKSGTLFTHTELVCHITAASASVASDKIFALHGIMKALGITLPPPDYKLSSSEVYWRASCALMRHQKSLDMMGIVNGSRQFTNVPSWVPDFDRGSPRWEMSSTWFHASGVRGGQKAAFEFLDEDRILVTKAKIVDVVQEVVVGTVDSIVYSIADQSNPNDTSDVLFGITLPSNIQTVRVLQSWIKAALKLRVPHRGQILKSRIDPFTNLAHQSGDLLTHFTMMPDVERMNEMIGYIWKAMTYPERLRLYYQAALKSGKVPKGFLENPDLIFMRDNLIEVQLLLVLIDQNLYESFLNAWKKAVGNVFLTTSDGHIGTGPVDTKKGDVIALIPSVRTPMILRNSESLVPNRYKVVGPAFVLGTMEGGRWTEHLSLEERQRGTFRYIGDDLPTISLE